MIDFNEDLNAGGEAYGGSIFGVASQSICFRALGTCGLCGWESDSIIFPRKGSIYRRGIG